MFLNAREFVVQQFIYDEDTGTVTLHVIYDEFHFVVTHCKQKMKEFESFFEPFQTPDGIRFDKTSRAYKDAVRRLLRADKSTLKFSASHAQKDNAPSGTLAQDLNRRRVLIDYVYNDDGSLRHSRSEPLISFRVRRDRPRMLSFDEEARVARKYSLYTPSQIQVLSHDKYANPFKASIDEQPYLFKLLGPDASHALKVADAIAAAGVDLDDLRICRLEAVIVDPLAFSSDYRNWVDAVSEWRNTDPPEEGPLDHRDVRGFLLTHVENKGVMHDLALEAGCTAEDPQRWYAQIQETVERLHNAGIAWGALKPRNVLIDEQGNAWLTGLLAGEKPAWSKRQYCINGDKEALMSIEEWLDKCEPVNCEG